MRVLRKTKVSEVDTCKLGYGDVWCTTDNEYYITVSFKGTGVYLAGLGHYDSFMKFNNRVNEPSWGAWETCTDMYEEIGNRGFKSICYSKDIVINLNKEWELYECD